MLISSDQINIFLILAIASKPTQGCHHTDIFYSVTDCFTLLFKVPQQQNRANKYKVIQYKGVRKIADLAKKLRMDR